MALTPAEESQTRELLAQQAAILALASEEPAIISSLGATDVSLSDLTAASSLGDADLLLVRQGVTDKSIAGSVIKASSTVPDASTTTKGIIEIATSAEVQAGTDSTRAVVTSALFAAMASIMTYFGFSVSLGANGYLKLPSILGGVIFQWGVVNISTSGSGGSETFSFPIAFPNSGFAGFATQNRNAQIAGGQVSYFYFNSTSQGLVTLDELSGTTAGTYPVYWFSIGH